MRKLVSVAMGGVAAFVGFAGAGHASATVDLIWIDTSSTFPFPNAPPICLEFQQRNCPTDPRAVGVPGYPDGVAIRYLNATDNITLAVILTPGPDASWGAGVSVNYAEVLPQLSVVSFQSLATTKPFLYLPLSSGTTTDQPPYIDHFNALADPPAGFGIGLPHGETAYLGTVMFHKEVTYPAGTYEIRVGADGPGGTDYVLDGFGNEITAATAFNSAYLITSPTPTPTPPPPTPTATPTATPTPGCEDFWPVTSIVTIAKGQSAANNLKVSHRVTGNIVDPAAICPDDGPCTAHRIPVCAGTEVHIAVTGSAENSNIGRGVISCDAAGCFVGAIDVVEKYKSVSADGKDTDRVTLLPQ